MSLDAISCSACTKLSEGTEQQPPLLCWNVQVVVTFKPNTNLTKINDNYHAAHNRSRHYHIIALHDYTIAWDDNIFSRLESRQMRGETLMEQI